MRHIINGSNLATWEWNVQTGETVFNERWAEIVGYTLEELQPISIDTWIRLSNPDDLIQSDQLLQCHFAGQSPFYDFESRMRHNNGTWIWVHDRGQVVEWTVDGKPLWMFGTHTDISDQKKSEEVLIQSEAKFSKLFNSNPSLMAVISFPENKLTDVNAAFLETTGYSREEVIGKTGDELGLFVDNDQLNQAWINFKLTGRMQNVELDVRKKDGTILNGLFSGEVIEYQGEKGFLNVMVDITKLKQAEENLRENQRLLIDSKKRYDLALEGAEVGLWDWDMQTNQVYLSPLWKKMIGYEDYELENTFDTWKNRWYPEDVPVIEQAIDDYLQGRSKKYEITHRLLHKNGEWRWMMTRGGLIRDASGNPVRWVGTTADVTDLINEREKHAELQRFFDISPDLMAIVDPSAKIRKSNKAWFDILGYTEAEILSSRLMDNVHPDDKKLALDQKLKANEAQQISPYFNRYRSKNGAYRTIEWHAQTHDGWYYLTGRDITEKIITDQKLNNNLVIRDSLVDILKINYTSISDVLDRALKDVIFFTGSKLGYIFLYNEEKEEFKLHSWSETVMDECQIKDKSKLYYLGKVGLWGEVVRQRKPIIINDFQAPSEMKKGYPDGHARIRNFISIPVFQNDRIVAVVGAANKETDYDADDILNLRLLMKSVWPVVVRIQAEIKLTKSHEELLKFAAQVPGMLYQYELSPDGKVRVPFSTDGIKDIFGCTPDEVRDDFSPVGKVIHPDDVNRMNDAIAESVQNLSPFQLEYRVLLPGQPVHWILAKSMPEKKEDGTIVFHGFNTDITDRKKLEAFNLERLKELNCINHVSEMLNYSDSDTNRLFVDITDVLNQSLNEPEQSTVVMTIHSTRYQAEPVVDLSGKMIRTDIFVNKFEVGSIEIYIPESLEFLLPFEQNLIDHIAFLIGGWLERSIWGKKITSERELFNTTLMSLDEGVILVNHSKEILLFNNAAEQITDYTREEVLNKKINDFLTMIDVHTRESVWLDCFNRLQKGERFDSSTDFALIAKDGTERRISLSSSQIKGENGEADRYIASFRDISKEYELEKQIHGFLDVNIDMLCVGDLDGNFHKINKKFEKVLGYRTEDIVGKNFMSFIHPDDVQITLEALTDLGSKEHVSGFINRYRCKDGSYKYIEWNSIPGVGRYIYTSARDVTPQRQLEEQLRQAAIKDDLTGLFNRHYFESIINEQMQHSDRYDEPLSMVLLDLDHFKQVNDTWGHPVGDELLKLTANTVGRTIRESDILVRFGGEEFAVLMPRTAIDGALHAAEKIHTAIENNPHATAGTRTASLGVAERMKAESFRHWYRRLDGALYKAKQTGRNRVVVSDGNEILPVRAFYLEWRLELLSGNNEIDQQHQELFEIGNRLISLSLEGANQEEIMKQLELLLNHTVSHFDCEEKILEQVGYPDLRHHAEIHKELASKVLRLKGSYGNGEIKASAFFSFIADDVILNHMISEDTKFFPYLKKR